MRVLVTGANGFIGSSICRYFSDKGIEVIGTGRSASSKIACEYIQADISSPDDINCLMERLEAVDAVIHAAAALGKADSHELLQTNCLGTQHLLEMSEKKGCRRIISISSLPIIGRPEILPITENHPISPRTIYHMTKWMQEQLVDYAVRRGALSGVNLRIPSPVGVGMNRDTILPQFIMKMKENLPVMLYGRGSRRQDYTSVDDIVRAVELCMEKNEICGTYNIASGYSISNYDLALLCKKLLQSDSEILFSDKEDPADSEFWDISIKKAAEELGFEPRVSIEDSIMKISRYLDGAI